MRASAGVSLRRSDAKTIAKKRLKTSKKLDIIVELDY